MSVDVDDAKGRGAPVVGPSTADPSDTSSGSNPGDATQRARPRTALVASIIVAVVIVGLIAVLATRPSGERAARSPLVGKPAPALEGDSMIGNGSFRLADARGDFVVVNFFATWCPPCVQEHPELVELAEGGRAKVVSVVYQDNASDVRDFFAKRGGDWPVLNLPRAAVAYGVVKVPESYVVDPNGVIVAKVNGGVTRARLERIIEQFDGDGTSG